MNIKNKTAIITGASAGIGLALAHELAKRGAHVVLAARSADKLKKIEKEIPGSLAVATDVTKEADLKKLFKKAQDKFGSIDILVNNAGVGLHAPIEKVDMKAYKSIMEVNVFSVLRAMQLAIPVMRAQAEKGTIVNVSSMVSKNFYPELAAYASTKYALNALTLTARAELEKEGIVVSAFHPRMTATEFGANSIGDKYDSSKPRPGMVIDTAAQVATAIAHQIESGDAEDSMQK